MDTHAPSSRRVRLRVRLDTHVHSVRAFVDTHAAHQPGTPSTRPQPITRISTTSFAIFKQALASRPSITRWMSKSRAH